MTDNTKDNMIEAFRKRFWRGKEENTPGTFEYRRLASMEAFLLKALEKKEQEVREQTYQRAWRDFRDSPTGKAFKAQQRLHSLKTDSKKK